MKRKHYGIILCSLCLVGLSIAGLSIKRQKSLTAAKSLYKGENQTSPPLAEPRYARAGSAPIPRREIRKDQVFTPTLTSKMSRPDDISPTRLTETRPAENQEIPTTTAMVEKPALKPIAPVASAGRRVFIDPATGEIRSPLPGEVLPLAVPAASPLATSSAGLVERGVATPGSGVMVDLRGRFRSAIVVTTDTEGQLSTNCLPSTADAVKSTTVEAPQGTTEARIHGRSAAK